MKGQLALFCCALAVCSLSMAADHPGLCVIRVVEQDTGWPVSLVELETTSNLRFVTDNAGVVAMNDPDLLGKNIWFKLRSPGYQVSKDGFGFQGVRLDLSAGADLTVNVQRTSIAKRLGRLTGSGLFAESQKAGEHLDWVDSGVFGQDSVQNAVYQGQLFWAWGDTHFSHYPLGEFHMTSATTEIIPLTSYVPPLKLTLNYFQGEAGRPRSVAEMPGDGPTWVSGYTALRDRQGQEHLVGVYVKIKPPLEAYECGLCEWSPEFNRFERVQKIWTKSDAVPQCPSVPDGHPALVTDAAGQQWIYFGNPLPHLRCPAVFEDWQNPETWESLKSPQALPAIGQPSVVPHTGSVAWNAYRRRWVTVFMEKFGKPSAFGELWYAEAEQISGPWGPAIKILSHDNYTFYNPRIHSEWSSEASPILLFEGTYTVQFANHPVPIPRYDYNQILYRLDLDDPALKPAEDQ